MQTDQSRPVAYLTSEYPKFSHTFIQREVSALRAEGEDIITCAIRRPQEEALTGPEEREEHRGTFAIMERARNPLSLLADIASIKLLRAEWCSKRAKACGDGTREWLTWG